MSALVLDFTSHQIKEGAYAAVLLDAESGRATKIFKNTDQRSHSEQVFSSEIRAYEIAVTNPEICSLVPEFFGRVTVANIVTKNPKYELSNFHPELAYQMSLEVGHFIKIGSIPSEESSPVQQLFKEAGIMHMSDASVVLNEASKIAKVIDFATQEYELWHDL